MSHKLFSTHWSMPVKLILAFCLGYAAIEWLPAFIRSEPIYDSSQACELSQASCLQNNASIMLSDNIVHPLQPTTMTIRWPELPKETNSLLLTLEGHEMMMGQYQLQLTRQPDDSFSGELMLPFCTQDAMTWQGKITSDSGSLTPLYVSLRMTQ